MTSVTFITFHPTTIRIYFIEPYFNKRNESPIYSNSIVYKLYASIKFIAGFFINRIKTKRLFLL